MGFPSQTFRGLIIPGWIPGARVPDVGANLLLLQEQHLSGEIPPSWVSVQLGWSFVGEHISASPTHVSVLLSFVTKNSSFCFQIFFHRDMMHM